LQESSLLLLNTGLLPLKLRTGADRRELDRALLLRDSLAQFWRGAPPFTLRIVCRDDEVEEAGREFGRARPAGNLATVFHRESEFFPKSSAFHKIPGMYRQQLIKLLVPAKLALGPFITFDSDVICLRPFDEASFVADGRLVSAWEPRTIHSWWENSMAGARIWSDMAAPGLGVTPNVLHSDICALAERYFRLQGRDAVTALADLTHHHPHQKTYAHESGISLVWSEYSLYTLIAEWFGCLESFHLSSTEVAEARIRLHSGRCIWSKDDAHRLDEPGEDPGYFRIIQSWVGISPDVLRAKFAAGWA